MPTTPEPKRQGLSAEQARALLQTHGPNALAAAESRSLWRTALEVVQEPMFVLLVACSSLYFLLGELREALALLVSVLVVMGITFIQERKTERALDALRDMASPRALVIRDGQRQHIDAHELVPGDLMVLSEGCRVPADGVLLDALHLSADESLLTGESVPVDKQTQSDQALPLTMAAPHGDATHCVFSGTLVVQGEGCAQVLATGARSEIGRIGGALSLIDTGRTPLQEATRRMVRTLAVAVLVLAGVVTLIMGFTRGNWVDAMLAGIAWAMALLPEEFPVVLTIFLALGAWRMSRQKVLTRRMPALETLGAATVLCVDKTGTLTENRMQVAQLLTEDGVGQSLTSAEAQVLPPAFHRLVRFAALASRQNPFDPMEQAIQSLRQSGLPDTESAMNGWTMVREYPLSRAMLAVTQVWQSSSEPGYLIASKGAPEAMGDLCHLPPERMQALHDDVSRLAEQGLRVLGVACARSAAGPLPDGAHDFDFDFLGLVALADPVRTEVPQAIAQCQQAGIRVIMITGDYPGTALSIARQAGLGSAPACLTGADVDALDDAQLSQRLRGVSVIARAAPALKLRIVRALQAGGEVVAMTGDGVNDAPALRAADIGIAMGGRGTDVAREAADLIVTDDRFSSIVEAIRLGRRVFANLTKASGYIVAIHLPIAGLSMLPVLLGWPLVLLPVHVAFLELMIDPACSVAFEAEPGAVDAMEKPPRRGPLSLFGAEGVWPWVWRGAAILAAVLAAHEWARHLALSTDMVRTVSFAMLIVGNVALILSGRAKNGGRLKDANVAMWAVMVGAVLALALLLWWPFMRGLFRLALPPQPMLEVFTGLSASLLLGLHLSRRLGRP